MVALAVLATSATAWALLSTAPVSQTETLTAGTITPATALAAGAVHYTKATLSWTAPVGYTPTSVTLAQTPGTLAGYAATNPTNPCTATGLSPYTTYTWTITYHYHRLVGGHQDHQEDPRPHQAHQPGLRHLPHNSQYTHHRHRLLDHHGGTTNTIKLYRPTAAGVTTGDVLVAQLGARLDNAVGLTGPAGWKKVTSATTTGGGYTNFLATYICVVGRATNCKKTQTTWTWSWSASTTSTNASGGILEFSGVTPTTPINAGTTDTHAPSKWTTATAPAVTTTQYDTQLVATFVSGGNQTFKTTGACASNPVATITKVWTNRNTNATVTHRHDSAACVPTAVQATTGTSASFTFKVTVGTNTYAWDSATLALNPR